MVVDVDYCLVLLLQLILIFRHGDYLGSCITNWRVVGSIELEDMAFALVWQMEKFARVSRAGYRDEMEQIHNRNGKIGVV